MESSDEEERSYAEYSQTSLQPNPQFLTQGTLNIKQTRSALSMPRFCTVRISRIEIPNPSISTRYSLAIALAKSPKRLLRSVKKLEVSKGGNNQQNNSSLISNVDFIFSFHYMHSLRLPNHDILRVLLQSESRKKEKKYTTVGLAELDLSRIIQSQLIDDIVLYEYAENKKDSKQSGTNTLQSIVQRQRRKVVCKLHISVGSYPDYIESPQEAQDFDQEQTESFENEQQNNNSDPIGSNSDQDELNETDSSQDEHDDYPNQHLFLSVKNNNINNNNHNMNANNNNINNNVNNSSNENSLADMLRSRFVDQSTQMKTTKSKKLKSFSKLLSGRSKKFPNQSPPENNSSISTQQQQQQSSSQQKEQQQQGKEQQLSLQNESVTHKSGDSHRMKEIQQINQPPPQIDLHSAMQDKPLSLTDSSSSSIINMNINSNISLSTAQQQQLRDRREREKEREKEREFAKEKDQREQLQSPGFELELDTDNPFYSSNTSAYIFPTDDNDNNQEPDQQIEPQSSPPLGRYITSKSKPTITTSHSQSSSFKRDSFSKSPTNSSIGNISNSASTTNRLSSEILVGEKTNNSGGNTNLSASNSNNNNNNNNANVNSPSIGRASSKRSERIVFFINVERRRGKRLLACVKTMPLFVGSDQNIIAATKTILEITTALSSAIASSESEQGFSLPLKVLIGGGDTYVNHVLRAFMEIASKRTRDLGALPFFYVIPIGTRNDLAYTIATQDPVFRQLFFGSEWLDAIDGQKDQVSDDETNDVQRKLWKYINEGTSVFSFPIGEALLSLPSKDASSPTIQKRIPFVKGLQVGSKEDTNANTTSSTNNALDWNLQLDYWWPKKKTEGHKELKSFSYVALTRLHVVAQALHIDSENKSGADNFNLFVQLKDKSTKERVKEALTFKNKKKEKEEEQPGPSVSTQITRLICSSSHDSTLFTVMIDGVEYNNIKFLAANPNWPSHVKVFPVQCFKSNIS